MSARTTPRKWEGPSPAIAELLKKSVAALLDNVDEFLAALDEAIFEVNRELLDLAPGLSDPLRAAGRSNVMVWAMANLRKPGLPVPANLSPENVDFARDVVRHGFDETILSGFRTGQNLAMQTLTDVAFRITDDHEALHALLRLASQSIIAYVDDTLDGITAAMRAERAQLRDAASAARAEAVTLILEGSPLSEGRATQLLNYEIGRTHTAVIVWSDDVPLDGALEAVTHDITRMAGAARPLTLPMGPSTTWIWLSGRAAAEAGKRLPPTADLGSIRIALGRPGTGLAGFRRSHHEALTAQRLARRLPLRSNLTSYDEVEVLALASANEDQAHEFVALTLGKLASAPEELRDTLRSYLRQECNLTRTAQVQFAHRNTVAARLDRARELLPHPLADRTLEVSLALEIARMIGPTP